MKVRARIEKELFRAVDIKDKLKLKPSSSDILMNKERIKVLTWILSDLDKDLDEM